MAWLATQMQNTSGSSAANNDKAIQEAIWQLTDASGAPNAAPNSSSGYNGTASSGSDSGTAQSAAHWIQDAQEAYIAGFNGTTSNWHLCLALYKSGGLATGTSSPPPLRPAARPARPERLGCTPGTCPDRAAPHRNSWPIRLADWSPRPPTRQAEQLPEPATFVLIGSGFWLPECFCEAPQESLTYLREVVGTGWLITEGKPAVFICACSDIFRAILSCIPGRRSLILRLLAEVVGHGSQRMQS